MDDRAKTNDLTMTLVEQALRYPESEREAFLRNICGPNRELFAEAWTYVQWEKRMQGFLLDPLRITQVQIVFEPGQILINRFRVVREVAQGGMGIVWEAIDEKLDRRVALKCAKAGFGKQLPPEVRNAREVSHPNVCKIFEIHTASTSDGEIDFISMEFLEGETLSERIRRAPLPKKEALTIARQLCWGLAEAHRNQLIHGDLKAKNVILTLDRDGSLRAVITDFGLACRTDASSGLVGGTFAYMAPEMLKGAKPSMASDIYALGILLRELRSGPPAAAGSLPSKSSASDKSLRWNPLYGVSKWDRIVSHCIDPDPNRRFKCASQIAEALGPPRLPKRLAAVAAAVSLAAVSGFVTYEHVTAPTEKVRLALLPFSSAPDDASMSDVLLRNTSQQLARLQGTAHTSFTFIPRDNIIRNRVYSEEEARVLLKATHALRATVEHQVDGASLHAYLTDLRPGGEVREWKAKYGHAEVAYAPGAIAALVTQTLDLRAPAAGASINAAASGHYRAGLNARLLDRTIDQAIEEFQQAAKADPSSALALAALADAQWFKFAATEDKVWMHRTIESVAAARLRNPDLPEVHSIQGLLESHEGKYPEAIADYTRAIELDPSNGDAYRRLGLAYEHSGELEKALTALRKAVQVDPNQYRNYRYLGDVFVERGKYRDAIPQFAKALALAPDEPLLHDHLGQAYQNGGQFDLAEKEVRASLALAERPVALHRLAVLLMYKRREEEAIPTLLRTLQLGPENSVAWMNLGTAYRRSGLNAKAADAYSHSLRLAQEDLGKNFKNALERSYLAFLCARQNNAGRAASEIAQALNAAPNDADVLFMATNTYEALGNRAAALSLLATAPHGVLEDVNRWPDLADLQQDSRFQELLSHRR